MLIKEDIVARDKISKL